MRILLQQKSSNLYFKDVGQWTQAGSEAMDFLSSTAAIDFCVLNKINDVQVVLKFEEEKYDIVLTTGGSPVEAHRGAPRKEL